MTEICGDGRLGALDRLRYLWRNLARNLGGRSPLVVAPFVHPRLAGDSRTASPSRALTGAWFHAMLPGLVTPGRVSVVEIGCGSGALSRRLASAGYHGAYLGVDVQDHFDRTPVAGFDREFRLMDAHQLEPAEPVDLVVSVSALEHIPDDAALIARLDGWLKPGGWQVHVVPSGWALPTYLWHGYRQYTAPALGDRFDPGRVRVFGLGGLASFLLHLVFITIGEMLSRLPVRKRLPGLYGRLLDAALGADRWLPWCPTMVVVCQRKPEERS